MSQSKTGLSRDETNRALNLIKALERHHDSYEFRYPVDHVGLGLTDYLDIIKYPMDLSTVKKGLQVGEYQNLQECIMDLQLIWDNCKLYNPEESYICQQAQRLQEFMITLCNNSNIAIPTTKRKPKEPLVSTQEKKDLSELIKLASINTLAHVCIIVEQDCPEAYTQIDRNKVTISLEKMNYSTFMKVKE